MTLPKIKKTNTGNKSKAAARILRALLCFAFWIGIWYIAAAALGKAVILPMPHDVAKRLIALAGTKDFVLTCLRSLGSVFAGIFFGMAFGSVLAVLSHFVPVVKTLASPMLSVVKATPVASFIILLLFLVNKTAVPPIATSLIVMPIVYSNVTKGFSSVPREKSEAARIYLFDAVKKWKYCYLPCIMPYFAAACRSAVGMAWKAGIAAEVICSPKGTIGSALYNAKIYLESEDMFAWTAAVIILSIVIEKLIVNLILGRFEKEERA